MKIGILKAYTKMLSDLPTIPQIKHEKLKKLKLWIAPLKL
jgi:hypothetical protein